MFMLWSDWCLEVKNRFGYNFYKVEGFVVELEGGGEGEVGLWEVVLFS